MELSTACVDIDLAKLLDGGLDDGLNFVVAGDVELEHRGLAPGGNDFVARRV